MKCNKCNTEMKLGIALWPYEKSYIKWIANYRIIAELLIPCWKCPTCGKSEELTKEEYQTLKSVI